MALLPSCRSEQAGAVIVAMQTDMEVPKDITHVGVFVSYDGQIKLSTIVKVGGVGATGRKVQLPSTLAVVSSEDKPDARVRVRVMGFVGTGAENTETESFSARVVRDSAFRIPKERRVLLRMPLQFVSDGSVKGSTTRGNLLISARGRLGFRGDQIDDYTGLGAYQFACPEGTTNILGECASAEVDAAALPEYREEEVFGGASADKAASGQCFDPKVVFANVKELSAVQPDCTTPVPSEQVNFAFATERDGYCLAPGKCLVPMDGPGSAAPFYTFETRNGALVAVFKSGVCKKLGGKVALSTALPVKTDRIPLCGGLVGSSTGTPVSSDGGAGDGGGTGVVEPRNCPDPVTGEVVTSGEALVSGLVVTGGQAYFVAATGQAGNVFALKRVPAGVQGTVQPIAFTGGTPAAGQVPTRFALAAATDGSGAIGIASVDGLSPFWGVFGGGSALSAPLMPATFALSSVVFLPPRQGDKPAFAFANVSDPIVRRLDLIGGILPEGPLGGLSTPADGIPAGITAMASAADAVFIGTAAGRVYRCPITGAGDPTCFGLTANRLAPPVGAVAVGDKFLYYSSVVSQDGMGSGLWRVPIAETSGGTEPVIASEGGKPSQPVFHPSNGVVVRGNYVYYARNIDMANVNARGHLYFSHVDADKDETKPFACPLGNELLDPGAVVADATHVYVAYRGSPTVTSPGPNQAGAGGIQRYSLLP